MNSSLESRDLILAAASEVLSAIKQMTLTTLDESGLPYSVIVYFLSIEADGGLPAVYWISRPTRAHSEHLESNNSVAIAVSKEYQPGDPPMCVFLSGNAAEVTDQDQVDQVWPQLRDRISPFFKDEFMETHKLYRADANVVRVWDETGQLPEMKMEVR